MMTSESLKKLKLLLFLNKLLLIDCVNWNEKTEEFEVDKSNILKTFMILMDLIMMCISYNFLPQNLPIYKNQIGRIEVLCTQLAFTFTHIYCYMNQEYQIDIFNKISAIDECLKKFHMENTNKNREIRFNKVTTRFLSVFGIVQFYIALYFLMFNNIRTPLVYKTLGIIIIATKIITFTGILGIIGDRFEHINNLLKALLDVKYETCKYCNYNDGTVEFMENNAKNSTEFLCTGHKIR